MKKLLLCMLLVLSVAAVADKEESVAALKARADAARDKQLVELSMKVAERQLQAVDQAYNDGDVTQAQAALQDVVTYGVKAASTAAQSGKKMKQTEIALRRIGEKLESIRKSLNSDDRPPVASAIEKLEAARTDLLNQMFKK